MSGVSAAVQFLDGPLPQRLGWTLLHFIWQGTVLALLLWVALVILRRSPAHVRGLAACAALLAMAGAPVVTFCKMEAPRASGYGLSPVTATGSERAIGPGSARTATEEERVRASVPAGNAKGSGDFSGESVTKRAAELAGAFVPWVTPVWLTGVCLCLARLLGGWFLAERMKRRGVRIAGSSLQQNIAELARRIGVSRPVVLLECALAQGPAVIGWLRPVILLPASAVSGLSGPELRAILAHELAHIRRYDYLINLLQCGMETLLFYHPGVWWVSARIREERENACDDIAAAACEDRLVLARALHALEAMREPFPALALAARDGDLLARIRRLLSNREPEAGNPAGALVTMLALCAAALLIQAPHSAAQATQAAKHNGASPAASPGTPLPDPSATFRAALQMIQDEAGKQTETAKTDYLAQLQGLLRNALQAGDERLALAAGAEISGVKAGDSDGQGDAPPEIAQRRDAFRIKLRSITDAANEKAQPFVSAYAAWLQAQAEAQDARGDAAGAAGTRMEWMSLRLRSADVRTTKTRRLGGGGGGQNTDLPKPYALLTGFKVRTGGFAGHHVITCLKAVFRSTNGTIIGNRRGPVDAEDLVAAADGYAVGAIHAHSGDRLDGFEIVFMKIDPSGAGLNPNDAYTSRWIGGHGGGGLSSIGGDGRPVVGVFGGNGLEIDSLGLIQATLQAAPLPSKDQQSASSNP